MAKNVVLVTGGSGYIGSHTVIELLDSGYEVVVVDNLSNSTQESLRRVEEIANKKILGFYKVDLRDQKALEEVFEKYKTRIFSVIHFAGLKAVGESNSIPLKYYDNNITGTLVLLELMKKYEVKVLVFSSSATVYGDVKEIPVGGLTEDLPTSATNPYGRTKLFIEEILKDLHKSDPQGWNIVILRYFNPVGAHPSGRIGEDPAGIPNNLMPYVTQVAVGKRPFVSVYGNDYNTKDGTGVRDFIHVVDLAKGHIAALKKGEKSSGLFIYNLGTGNGSSVLDMINSMKKASGKDIAFKFVDRRPGDVATCFASPEKAKRELDWVATLNVDRMCEDAWRWQSNNPNGYADKS